ncbi:MAG: hypothetical protein SGPRY_005905 [Prymnesium sp.]
MSAVLAEAWPDYLLENDCAKGLALVVGASLPRIMNVIPSEDPTALEVYPGQCDGPCERALREGESVPAGAPLTLVYAGVMGPDTRTAFVSSQGHMHGAKACGTEGGSLLTTGWLKQATWTPTSTGVAQVAVGFAHGNFGTPAVTVGIKTFMIAPKRTVTPNEQSELQTSNELLNAT